MTRAMISEKFCWQKSVKNLPLGNFGESRTETQKLLLQQCLEVSGIPVQISESKTEMEEFAIGSLVPFAKTMWHTLPTSRGFGL